MGAPLFRKPATLVIAACATLAINVLGAAEPRAEQQPPPPIQGVTGTIATETSVHEVHDGARALLVKAKRLFRWTRRSPAASGDEAGEEAVDGLRRGMAVVVHDTTSGDLTAAEIEQLNEPGLKRMEGVILSVDRTDRTIAIRMADGTRQAFRLSDRAADALGKDADRAADGTTRVVVFVKGEAGERTVHYFKRVS
jgi:hypothetical protein